MCWSLDKKPTCVAHLEMHIVVTGNVSTQSSFLRIFIAFKKDILLRKYDIFFCIIANVQLASILTQYLFFFESRFHYFCICFYLLINTFFIWSICVIIFLLVTIIKNKETRVPKGFAYVLFDSDQDATAAMKEMDGRVNIFCCFLTL